MKIYGKDYNGFVYIWYDTVAKMYYIGSHEGSIEDPYSGSSPRFINAYRKRKDKFRRRIIKYNMGSRQSLYNLEQYYLNMIKNEELQIRYYNFRKSAYGNDSESASRIFNEFYASEAGSLRLQQLSYNWINDNPSKSGNVPWNKGRECPSISEGLLNNDNIKWKDDEERVKSHSDRMKHFWSRGIFDNRPPRSTETTRKAANTRRNNSIGQTDYQKQMASEANKGKILTEETKSLLSISRKNTPQCSCIKCKKTMQTGRMKVHLKKCK